MKALGQDQLDLIDALVAETDLGGITAGLLEKDAHLTDALRALFKLPLQGMHLVFCGGTSLSKAHRLIERMSEDADLKIVLDAATLRLSRAQIRARLSALKAEVSQALTAIGLVEDPDRALALNENHYFRSEWSYRRKYESAASLRPKLQVELTVRAPVLKPPICLIASLSDQLAGRQQDAFPVATVALAETMAEKVLSFLRRFAQHRAGLSNQAWDSALVRHVYDVHCIHVRRPKTLAESLEGFAALVAVDQQEFGKQFPEFARTARPVLARALAAMRGDAATRSEYEQNLLPLIYGNLLPDYPTAFKSFETVAKALLATLPKRLA